MQYIEMGAVKIGEQQLYKEVDCASYNVNKKCHSATAYKVDRIQPF
jgi:hypothetical protein